MLLQRPDPVVAHDRDDVYAVAGEGVELHPAEAECPVADEQDNLAVGVGDLGCQRVTDARTQAAERPGIEPAARLVGVDEAAGVGDEVPAVADHDRVTVEELVQLGVDAHGMEGRAVVLELLTLGRALLVLDLAQARDPRAGAALEAGRALPDRVERRRDAAVTLGRRLAGVRPLGLDPVDDDDLGLLTEGLAEGQPEVHRHADDDRYVGLAQAGRAGPGEEELVVGRHAAPRQAVEEDRDTALADELLQGPLAVAPPEAGAGHDHRALGVGQQRHRPVDPLGRNRLGGRVGQRRRGPGLRALGEDDVEREVDEGRPAGRGERLVERLVDQLGDLAGVRCRRREPG